MEELYPRLFTLGGFSTLQKAVRTLRLCSGAFPITLTRTTPSRKEMVHSQSSWSWWRKFRPVLDKTCEYVRNEDDENLSLASILLDYDQGLLC